MEKFSCKSWVNKLDDLFFIVRNLYILKGLKSFPIRKLAKIIGFPEKIRIASPVIENKNKIKGEKINKKPKSNILFIAK
jgi:hypothetical protein